MELTKVEERIKKMAISDVQYNAAKRIYYTWLVVALLCAFFITSIIISSELYGSIVSDAGVFAGIIIFAFMFGYSYRYKYEVYGLIRKMNEEIEQLKQEQK